MWSVGVILYILLCGYPPFVGTTRHEIFEKIENCIYSLTSQDWAKVSKPAKDLIRKLIILDDRKRLTPEQALQHEWFKTFDKARKESTLVQNSEEKVVDGKILNMLKNYRTTSKFKNEAMKIFVN